MTVYEIENPMFLADTFIFGEITFRNESFYCFVKVNCQNKIEEIGAEINMRLFGHLSIEKIIEKSKVATILHKSIFKRFDKEYWVKVILNSTHKGW